MKEKERKKDRGLGLSLCWLRGKWRKVSASWPVDRGKIKEKNASVVQEWRECEGGKTTNQNDMCIYNSRDLVKQGEKTYGDLLTYGDQNNSFVRMKKKIVTRRKKRSKETKSTVLKVLNALPCHCLKSLCVSVGSLLVYICLI